MLGNKEIMSKNIKYYMKKKGIDRNQLCYDLNLKYMTVSDWINGKTYPRIDKIELLANYFNVNKSDLVENKENQSPLTQINEISSKLEKERQQIVLNTANKQYEEQNKVTSLDEYKKECNLIEFPKIGATGAGIGEELYADIIEDTIEVYEDEIPDGADFCILINGDSMEPIFKKGSYAFIEKKHEAKNGQIVLVLLEGSALIKKFETDCVSPKLVSLNPEYKDIYVETHHQFKVLGKVVM
ncbi:XRE family transcriptional regulator [Staphylococcus pseudoxylosus]|uniref:XRE family transcriptional regulator n=1 Tax=Staphylococcus pseudoxylosus TaxID=2282419 RepID=UPI002DB5A74E|nr:XRE family transcriptional regulator [Staphylococcus pseudoxylosus]MEB7753320.1 XRE family transcriptional regulator [Staphylococcus pseudoxylosus]